MKKSRFTNSQIMAALKRVEVGLAVEQRSIPIRLACSAFMLSESCYRYESRQNAENEIIADWLLRLTDNHRTWGFGLCYLYLRIKPRKRLVREKPEPLAVSQAINQVWSMDFLLSRP